MLIIYEWVLTLLPAFIILLLHDFVLRMITRRQGKAIPMVWVMLILSLTHVLQIWIYAVAIYIAVEWAKLGQITGCTCDEFIDFVYFSASNYTSLGYGDYVATGTLRLLVTFEGLVGLLMIGWSTAFAFWWMQRHWLDTKY